MLHVLFIALIAGALLAAIVALLALLAHGSRAVIEREFLERIGWPMDEPYTRDTTTRTSDR